MKGLVSSIKESIFDPVKFYDKILSKEELNYKFKVLSAIGRGTVEDIILRDSKEYQKDPEILAKSLKQDIIIDKILVDNGFNQRDRSKLSMGSMEYGPMYFFKTSVNKDGYCVVFDPYITDKHGWVFLVTRAASKAGKTLQPVEWVEPKCIEEKYHQYDIFNGIVERTFYDDPVEAWGYIEKKYGKF